MHTLYYKTLENDLDTTRTLFGQNPIVYCTTGQPKENWGLFYNSNRLHSLSASPVQQNTKDVGKTCKQFVNSSPLACDYKLFKHSPNIQKWFITLLNQ